MDEHETRSPISSCRRRLLILGRLLLHLGCLGYSLYIIWLLAYLKDNPYYWFLGLIPFTLNLFFPMSKIIKKTSNFEFRDTCICGNCICAADVTIKLSPAGSVVIILMTCFTMLTRLAYYHRQPDEFIGPRFIVMSLQGSIILIFFDFYLQREGKLENLLNYKDAMTRMLLDFVDIFNMVEVLSANQCVGVGSFVTESSHTERSIQAFCTMSFFIFLTALSRPDAGFLSDSNLYLANLPRSNDKNSEEEHDPRTGGELLNFAVTFISGYYQNLPFLVIRIVIWAKYKLYSLGFLVKNAMVIVMFTALYVKAER